MDVFKDRELEARAKHLYTHMHKNFNMSVSPHASP